MLVILPFEKEFYKKFGFDVEFVGHPLLDAVSDTSLPKTTFDKTKPIIALLPGSRKQEILEMLPLMLSVKDSYKDYQFIVAGAPSQPASFYEEALKGTGVKIVFDQTYDLLRQAHAALVTSGTATLEAALLGAPEVVCYKGGRISFMIAKSLVKVKYISLVNLIMDKVIVTELIQQELNTPNLKKELDKLLEPSTRAAMLNNYAELKTKLGGGGASRKAAESIMRMMKP